MKNSGMKGSVVALASVMVMLAALAMACSDGDNEVSKTGKIGDKLKTDKFEIKVSPLVIRTTVGSLMKETASTGAIFVAIPYTFKNISKEPVSTTDAPDIKLVSPEGTEYDPAVGASMSYSMERKNDTKIISDINPGITQNESTVFEVAKEEWNKKGWKIRISADKTMDVIAK